jgi:hypothetical protein
MICPVDIRYEPFDCGPTVYVGNSVDVPAIAAELAPIKADTTHDTMLDDLLVMNCLPIHNVRKLIKTSGPTAPMASVAEGEVF